MSGLRTERLVLRRWRVVDAEQALPIYSDPEVTRFIGGQTAADLDAMRAQLQTWAERGATYPAGQGAWAAWHGEQVVGTGLLKPLPDADRVPTAHIEVGWHLGRAWWGRGFATEIGARLLRYGFDELGLQRIHAVVEPGNPASVRVAQRLGMAHQGQTEAFYGLTMEHFVLDRAR